jgi:hypothetical protein
VKENQPSLLVALEAIDEKSFGPEHMTTNRGHGRIETRYAAVAPVPAGLFPHATQVVRVTRDRADLSNEGTITVAWYITSLPADRAERKSSAIWPEGIGASRTVCTGCATSSTGKTRRPSGPGTLHG